MTRAKAPVLHESAPAIPDTTPSDADARLDAQVHIYADPDTRLLYDDVYDDLHRFGIPHGYRAADAGSAYGAQRLFMNHDEIHLLASHHTDSHRYLLLAESEPFGHPGEDEILALEVVLDHDQRTFATLGSWHATIAFGQLDLIRHGCPAEQIGIADEFAHLRGTDPATAEVNDHIRTSGERYRVEGTYTTHAYPYAESWTVAEDMHAGHGDDPIRVFLETVHLPTGTYQIGNHGFRDLEAAAGWLTSHAPDLPPRCHHQLPATATRPAAAAAPTTPTAARNRH